MTIVPSWSLYLQTSPHKSFTRGTFIKHRYCFLALKQSMVFIILINTQLFSRVGKAPQDSASTFLSKQFHQRLLLHSPRIILQSTNNFQLLNFTIFFFYFTFFLFLSCSFFLSLCLSLHDSLVKIISCLPIIALVLDPHLSNPYINIYHATIPPPLR